MRTFSLLVSALLPSMACVTAKALPRYQHIYSFSILLSENHVVDGPLGTRFGLGAVSGNMTSPNGKIIATVVSGVGGEMGLVDKNGNFQIQSRNVWQFVDDKKYAFIEGSGIGPLTGNPLDVHDLSRYASTGYEPRALLSLSLPILSNPQLSTPAQSPRPSPTSSDRLVQDILNATGVTDDFADFNLNPAAFEVPLPPTPSDASSLDTVELDLQDQVLSLQLGTTEYHFAAHQFELYEQLLSAHTRSEVHRLSYQDRLYLLEFAQLGLPSPTEPSIAPIVVPAAATTVTVPVLTMSTPTVIIADRNYSIAKLQGQDDYQVWRIQMEDMFQDVDVWDIVSGVAI
ncbi:Copia protein [Ceratobasidium sp. AG-Ba]|nr:Copia protein [Ceratobasidium sp. AG-Ba]